MAKIEQWRRWMVWRRGSAIGVRTVNRAAAPVYVSGLAESMQVDDYVLVGAYNRSDAKQIGSLDLRARVGA